jgi:hypothetical protein
MRNAEVLAHRGRRLAISLERSRAGSMVQFGPWLQATRVLVEISNNSKTTAAASQHISLN